LTTVVSKLRQATADTSQAVVRDELVWQVAHEDDVAESSLGLWLWDGEAYAWGIDCAALADGLLSPQTQPGPADRTTRGQEHFCPLRFPRLAGVSTEPGAVQLDSGPR